MKRLIATLVLVGAGLVPLDAELRRAEVPMDQLPMPPQPTLKTPHWWEVSYIPLDHPYWWTLADEVKPADLRKRLQERHLALQLEAAEEMRRGSAAQSTEAPQRKTAWVVDGSETPELFAAWDALHAFSSVMVARKTKERQERELVEFGLEPSAAAQIVSIAEQVEAKQIELWQETFRERQRLQKLLREASVRRGAGEARRIREESDVAALASISSMPIDQVREVATVSSRDTTAAATIPMMVQLRSIIGEEQWNLFRRYLFTEVTPYMSKSVIFRSDS